MGMEMNMEVGHLPYQGSQILQKSMCLHNHFLPSFRIDVDMPT